MALFIVKILGSNAVAPYADAPYARFGVDAKGVVTITPAGKRWPNSETPAALFESKDDAHTVGLACRWNSQRYVVRAARGHIRTTGVRVTGLADGVVSCQEGYGR